jgi:competence protein ComEC
MILSHPHPDHMNGLLHLVDRFEVGALWTSGDDGENPVYHRLIDGARRRGVALPPPAPLSRDGLRLQPVGPFWGDEIAAPPGLSANDASLVVRLEYGGQSLLFAGDIEEAGEAELVARGRLGVPVRADLLKVPHHGSRTSSSDELLEAVRPALAVMSLGRQNRFRFPAPEVVARYEAAGVRLLRTDLHGAVTVTVAPAGALDVRCERPCP